VSYTVRFFRGDVPLGVAAPFTSQEVAIRHARQLPLINKATGATSVQVKDATGRIVFELQDTIDARP
jgi:hypothetical protein